MKKRIIAGMLAGIFLLCTLWGCAGTEGSDTGTGDLTMTDESAITTPEITTEAAETRTPAEYPLSEGADIRIMSNNVWNCDKNQDAWAAKGEDCSYTSRGPGLAKLYIAFQPDIINTQEMTWNMIKLLKKEINSSGLHYKYLTTYPDGTDFTSILYNSDTLKMLENGQHIFTYGSDANSKGWHWALFEHIATGEKFIDLSTHLWWKSETAQAGSVQWRADQAAEIVAFANQLIEKYNVPVIVQGDLNMNISEKGYSVLLDGGFSDCQKLALSADNTRGYHSCTKTGYTTYLSEGDYSRAIDHSLIKNAGDWQIICFRQPVFDYFWPLTDHIPLYIDIKF